MYQKMKQKDESFNNRNMWKSTKIFDIFTRIKESPEINNYAAKFNKI